MGTRSATWMLALGALGVIAAARLMAGPVGLSSDVKDLGSSDAAVRSAAVDKVKKLGKDAVPDLLDELASDHDSFAKATLAEIVRDLGVPSSEGTTLANLLSDRDFAARQAALVILASTPTLAKAALISLAASKSADPSLRAGAAEVLGGVGGEVRHVLAKIAGSPDAPETVRCGALAGLALTGPSGCDDVKTVVTAQGSSEALRQAGIAALGRKEAAGAMALKALIASPVVVIRSSAMAALAGLGDTSTVVDFVPGLTDPAPEPRLEALRAVLGLGGGTKYRENVITMLGDMDDRVVAVAARSVGQTCGDIAARVNPALLGLLFSMNFQVRYEASLALNALGDKTGLATMQADAMPPNLSQQQQATQAINIINGK